MCSGCLDLICLVWCVSGNACVFVGPWGTGLCESDGPCLQDCSEDSVTVTDGRSSEMGCVGGSGACNER